MRCKKRSITITCDIPIYAEPEEVAEYIVNALGSWGGSLHPEDPMFDSIDVRSVKIGSMVYQNGASTR